MIKVSSLWLTAAVAFCLYALFVTSMATPGAVVFEKYTRLLFWVPFVIGTLVLLFLAGAVQLFRSSDTAPGDERH